MVHRFVLYMLYVYGLNIMQTIFHIFNITTKSIKDITKAVILKVNIDVNQVQVSSLGPVRVNVEHCILIPIVSFWQDGSLIVFSQRSGVMIQSKIVVGA